MPVTHTLAEGSGGNASSREGSGSGTFLLTLNSGQICSWGGSSSNKQMESRDCFSLLGQGVRF